MKLYQAIAQKFLDIQTDRFCGDREMLEQDTISLEELLAYLPEGNGTQLDLKRSTPDKLVFTTSFNHYDDNTQSIGRTDYTITVRHSFTDGFAIAVSGPNRNNIKDYIADVFQQALSEEVSQ